MKTRRSVTAGTALKRRRRRRRRKVSGKLKSVIQSS
jgi:hypothetical protein